MLRRLRLLSAAAGLLAALTIVAPAFAQKQGGILRMSTPDSPASMSIHEESTVFAQRPMMGVFNKLVMFDQHAPQASLESNRARSGNELVVERGWDGADLRAAAGRQAGPGNAGATPQWRSVPRRGRAVRPGSNERRRQRQDVWCRPA